MSYERKEGRDIIEDENEAFSLAMLLSYYNVVPQVLKVAIELDLFNIISELDQGVAVHVSPSEIASRLQTTNHTAPSMIDRLLRLLANHSLLACSSRTLADGRVERLYGLSPASKFYVQDKGGGSLASFPFFTTYLPFAGGQTNSWSFIKSAILEGGNAFEKAHGMHLYHYTDKHHAFDAIFNRAMAEHSALVTKRVLETYKGFEGLHLLVDVGGGTGVTLDMIIRKYPAIKGINFDLPHVIQNSTSYDGIEHVAGNMFDSIPKGEAILLKWICHNWNDERCLRLLKNCYNASPKGGKVIIVDSIVSETLESTFTAKLISHLDLSMMCFDGRERTQIEFETLARTAGFLEFKVICCAYANSVMELVK